MKDRDLLLHRMADIADGTIWVKDQFPEFISVQTYRTGEAEVHLTEEGFLEMFPDATGFRIRLDGSYDLETYVDGVRFFAITDEVAR